MAQRLNPHFTNTRISYRGHFMSWLPHFPSSSLLVAWESSRGRPIALGPCVCVADPEEAPGCWLQVCSALAIAAMWEVNQWMEDFFCLSFSL